MIRQKKVICQCDIVHCLLCALFAVMRSQCLCAWDISDFEVGMAWGCTEPQLRDRNKKKLQQTFSQGGFHKDDWFRKRVPET